MIFMFLKNYLFGFVNITVEGFYTERFINNCIKNRIRLWKIKRKNSTLITTNISVKDFKRINDISLKTKCRIRINNKFGIPFILHRYRKRKILAILIIPIAIIIGISSMFVWNVEINGIENINREELIEQLNEQGVRIGKLKNKIDTQKVINNIRLNRDDISWMSIDTKGTNVIVNIVEADLKPNIINKDEYCNIVSNRRGIITKITADSGTALFNVGDIVEIGDILIAGYMDGKYTQRRYVHSRGTVEAKVWYTEKIESGLTREVTNQTGNKKDKYSIKFNNFQINLFKSIPKFQNYDTICRTNKIKIFSNFYLPIEIIKTTYIEKETNEVTYGKEELKNILIDELEEKFNEKELDNSKITNRIVNIYNKDNNKIEVEMIYEVLEEIGTEEKFEI